MEYTVVSVGPYRFQASVPVSRKNSLSVRGSASPPERTRTPSGLRQPEWNSMLHVAGVACMTVGRTLAMRSLSRSTSLTAGPSQDADAGPAHQRQEGVLPGPCRS